MECSIFVAYPIGISTAPFVSKPTPPLMDAILFTTRKESYPDEMLEIAISRGFDYDEHMRYISFGDIDNIALTHPSNWLTAEETEEYFD
jgi:hypothetical protein